MLQGIVIAGAGIAVLTSLLSPWAVLVLGLALAGGLALLISRS